jgi:hypothetical protein
MRYLCPNDSRDGATDPWMINVVRTTVKIVTIPIVLLWLEYVFLGRVVPGDSLRRVWN